MFLQMHKCINKKSTFFKSSLWCGCAIDLGGVVVILYSPKARCICYIFYYVIISSKYTLFLHTGKLTFHLILKYCLIVVMNTNSIN